MQAASGIDASNVAGDELALLPADPDASALALRNGLRDRLGVEVAVVVTDTMGRAWRVGPDGRGDRVVGAARCCTATAAQVDRQGNELAVTEIAVADEVAGAADLVKGKLGAVPVAVVRGLAIGDATSHGARPGAAGGRGPVPAGHRGGDGVGPALGGAAARPVRSFDDAPVDAGRAALGRGAPR